MSEFKDIIKKLRIEKNLSQAELASELGTSNSTVAMWEIGRRYPSKELYEQIADFFNVDMDYLYGRTDIRQKIHFDNDGNAMVHSSAFYSRMLAYCEKLNDLGKQEAEKRISELTQLGIYVDTRSKEEIIHIMNERLEAYNNYTVAAHNDHHNEPEELEKMQRDADKLKRPE